MKTLYLYIIAVSLVFTSMLRAQTGIGLATSTLIYQDLSTANPDLSMNLGVAYLLTSIDNGTITSIDGTALLGSGLSGNVSVTAGISFGGISIGPEWSVQWSTSVHNGQIFLDYTIHTPGNTWSSNYYTGYRASIFTEPPTQSFAYADGDINYYSWEYTWAFYTDDYATIPDGIVTIGDMIIIDDDVPITVGNTNFNDPDFWIYCVASGNWNT